MPSGLLTSTINKEQRDILEYNFNLYLPFINAAQIESYFFNYKNGMNLFARVLMLRSHSRGRFESQRGGKKLRAALSESRKNYGVGLPHSLTFSEATRYSYLKGDPIVSKEEGKARSSSGHTLTLTYQSRLAPRQGQHLRIFGQGSSAHLLHCWDPCKNICGTSLRS